MPVNTRRRSRRAFRATLTAGALVVTAAISPLGSSAAVAGPSPNGRPFVSGVETIPAYRYADAIHERVAVETGTDSDEDGAIDLVYVDLIRPKEADRDGIKIPVIVQASPYYEVFSEPGEYDDNGVRIKFQTWLDNYFVPRGYAFAFVDLIGTHRATGCDDVGGDLEIAGTKAVVDWFNGRAKGYDEDGNPTEADWSTGKVGMIGVSWNGTIANAVASTGVEGLETIVPIASISSWYDYTRSFGSPYFRNHMRFLHKFVSNFSGEHCRKLSHQIDRRSEDLTGDYNNWWTDRNYRLNADQVTASVYVVHGLSDENVKTRQFGTWWNDLGRNGVERRIFLHQGVHMDPFSFREEWVPELKVWFDYYLQGLDNGVPDGPMAKIEREDGTFTTEDIWPTDDSTLTTFQLSEPLSDGAGSLAITKGSKRADVPAAGDKTVTWTEGKRRSFDSIVLDPTAERKHRGIFLSNKLDADVRMSGTSRLSVLVKVDRPVSGFQARVVDYGTATRYLGVAADEGVTCWGQGDDVDTGCYQNQKVVTSETDLSIITRTKADVGHYASLRHKELLVPDTWYRLEFHLATDDVIFQAGHRIGLVLTAEYDNPNVRPYKPVTMTIDPAQSTITMPLDGDTSSLSTPGTHEPILGTRIAQPLPLQSRKQMLEEFINASR